MMVFMEEGKDFGCSCQGGSRQENHLNAHYYDQSVEARHQMSTGEETFRIALDLVLPLTG